MINGNAVTKPMGSGARDRGEDRRRGGARRQMQELSTRKFHGVSSEMSATPSVGGHATRSVRVRGRHIEGHYACVVVSPPDGFAGPSCRQIAMRGATAHGAARGALDQLALTP